MVYAFLIHTLGPKQCDIAFYRFYTCYYSQYCGDNRPTSPKHRENKINQEAEFMRMSSKSIKLFETTEEKKSFLEMIASKVKMHYTMKINHSLLPIKKEESSIRGTYLERKWKVETGTVISILWQTVGNLSFVLICKKSENMLQAQNILDIIVKEMEKYLQFRSNPVVMLTDVETVSLIVNQFLPSGEIIFMNSKLLKSFEKQLEDDLYK